MVEGWLGVQRKYRECVSYNFAAGLLLSLSMIILYGLKIEGYLLC